MEAVLKCRIRYLLMKNLLDLKNKFLNKDK